MTDGVVGPRPSRGPCLVPRRASLGNARGRRVRPHDEATRRLGCGCFYSFAAQLFTKRAPSHIGWTISNAGALPERRCTKPPFSPAHFAVPPWHGPVQRQSHRRDAHVHFRPRPTRASIAATLELKGSMVGAPAGARYWVRANAPTVAVLRARQETRGCTIVRCWWPGFFLFFHISRGNEDYNARTSTKCMPIVVPAPQDTSSRDGMLLGSV